MYVLMESYLDLGRRLIPLPTRRGSATASASSCDSSPLSAGVRSSTLWTFSWMYSKYLLDISFQKKYYLRDNCPSCVDVCQSTFEYRRGGGHSQHDGCQDSQLVVHVPALIHISSLEGHLLYDDFQNLRLTI